MTNIRAAQILVGYFLAKQLESMKPERWQMTNLKRPREDAPSVPGGFLQLTPKGKNNPPQILTKPSTDAVRRPGVRSGVSLPLPFNIFFSFFFFWLLHIITSPPAG